MGLFDTLNSKINNIKNLKDSIVSKLIELGFNLDNTSKLGDCKNAINTIALKTSSNVTASASDQTVTTSIPAGYYADDVVKTQDVSTGDVSTSKSGATVTITKTAGYITSGTSTETISDGSATLSNDGTSTTITLTKTAGYISDGTDTLSLASYVSSENIVNGKSILGVTGTGGLRKWVVGSNHVPINEFSYSGSIPGSYTDYTNFGLKVGYLADGSVIIITKGSSNTSYESVGFQIASGSISGVSIRYQTIYNNSSYAASDYYFCIIDGISQEVTIRATLGDGNSTNDYYMCSLVITAA